ncbi:hypothetical protein AX14_006080 [Amanita brunnescens Koide BX004]|nr:hypothetical protein AX14_006080 [Amanita brunnescens Koide BX004]
MTDADVELKCVSPTAKMDKDDNEKRRLERNTLRQIDLRVIPILGLLCALDFMDRANLGIARVAGMDRDLHLNVGTRYSVLSLVYFVPYLLLQVSHMQLPSNLFVRRIGARNTVTFCVVSWGIVQLSMGFVPSWGYLTLCRVLLGAMEAGFFPALVFIISTWYVRHEVQKRLAAVWLIAILAGGLSPIFAYLISLLGGKLGITSWSWIFIVEGAITITSGLLSWRYLPDFPDQNQFLDAEQTELVLRRIEEDRGDSAPDVMTRNKVKSHLLDWKLWAFGEFDNKPFGVTVSHDDFCRINVFLCDNSGFRKWVRQIPNRGYSSTSCRIFITIILESMGWNIKDSMLLSAPPFIVAVGDVTLSCGMPFERHDRGLIT